MKLNFSSVQFRSLVSELAQPAGRMVGTAGHEQAARWVDWQLAHRSFRPYVGPHFRFVAGGDGAANSERAASSPSGLDLDPAAFFP